MKKGYVSLLCLLLGISLLAGCGQQGGQEPPAAENPVVFFQNSAEYDRLFSVRTDGTDVHQVLDKAVYQVQSEGSTVCYTSQLTISGETTLYCFNAESGEDVMLAEGVMNYQLLNGYVAYTTTRHANFGASYSPLLRLAELKTGKTVDVGETDYGSFCFSGDAVYYTTNDFDREDTYGLCAYIIDSGETLELTRTADYIDTMLAVDGGIYFRSGDMENSQWFHAKYDGTEGSGVSDFAALIPSDATPIYVAEGASLYLSPWDESLIQHLVYSADGSTTELLTSTGYTEFRQVGDGLWLVRTSEGVGWGETDENGYYNNYASRNGYYLLTVDGTLTKLNVTGALGQLFPDGDFPQMDSSTARKPVTTQLYNLFVGNFGYEGAQPLCSTTHNAWLNIADSVADIALLAAPTEEEQAYLEEKGVKVDMKLYGGDGLVFIGNRACGVESLTRDELLAIYRGEITNWSELGGVDHAISVYFRDDQSGSQRLFEKLAFKGQEIPDFEALGFQRNDEMSTIVNTCLYDPYAIGYSIMTYLSDVYAEADLQVYAIDGVTPSVDTVKDQSYPYNTQGYVVIRADEAADSPARRLYDWFGCTVSDELLTNAGITPLHN